MPYVPREARERIELPYVTNLGEFTYVVDKMAEELAWKLTGYDWSKLSHDIICRIDGAIGLAQAEFRRRIYAPHEDRKIEQNGDIFVQPHPEMWDIQDRPDLQVVPDEDALVEEPPAAESGRARLTLVGAVTAAASFVPAVTHLAEVMA